MDASSCTPNVSGVGGVVPAHLRQGVQAVVIAAAVGVKAGGGRGASATTSTATAPCLFSARPTFVIAHEQVSHSDFLDPIIPKAQPVIGEVMTVGNFIRAKGPTSAYRALPGGPGITRAQGNGAPSAYLAALIPTTPCTSRRNVLRTSSLQGARIRVGILSCCRVKATLCTACGVFLIVRVVNLIKEVAAASGRPETGG